MKIPNVTAIQRLRNGHCMRCGMWASEGPFCAHCIASAASTRAQRALLIDLIERGKIVMMGDEFGTLNVAHSHGCAMDHTGESVDVYA